MLNPRRRRPSGDTGVTLVELMVGMGLVTVVGAIATQFFLGSTQQANRVTDQSLDAADARTAIEHIAAELRLADSPTARAGTAAGRFETITATRVVFYANLDPRSRTGSTGRIPPTRVDIAVNDTQLVEKTYSPVTRYAAVPSPAPTPSPTPYPSPYDYTTNYPSNPSSQAVLINGLKNTSAVFSYCASTTDPSVNCTSTTDLKAVSSVSVVLTLAPKQGNTDQTVQTTVAIPGALS